MKSSVSDFAVFGGDPVFDEMLLVGRPAMPDRTKLRARLDQVLASGILTNGGPQVTEFEHVVASQLGIAHAVAVCNGTMALQIMARACDLRGEVIIPAMTFIATAHALAWIGLTPVFADVDLQTHTLTPASVEACLTENTAAVLGVHLWGNLCDIAALRGIGRREGIPVLFDASHAFGTGRDHLKDNAFGDAEAISFHATKVASAIEGGAVITNDAQIAQRCRLLRNFGIAGLTEIEALGTNGKMNELCAAAGLTCLDDINSIFATNHRNLQLYRTVVGRVPGLQVAIPETGRPGNAQYIVVTVDSDLFGLSRDQLVAVLRAEGVFARTYFAPGCHRAAPYADQPALTPVPLAVTERLLETVLQLPTGSAVSPEDIHKIGLLLSRIYELRDPLRKHAHRIGRYTATAA